MFIMFRGYEDQEADFMKAFERLAYKYSDQLLFSYADLSSNVQLRVADVFGIEERDFPTLRAINV